MENCTYREPCGLFCLDAGCSCIEMMYQIGTAFEVLAWNAAECIEIPSSCNYAVLAQDFMKLLLLFDVPFCDTSKKLNSSLSALKPASNATGK